MSKVLNSIHGLALGDALGYITERMRFKDIIRMYGNDRELPGNKSLRISDDTQMSIALMQAVVKFEKHHPQAVNKETRVDYIVDEFLNLTSAMELRGAGRATVRSLSTLRATDRSNPYIGSIADAKGSGTVMRSPWTGLGTIIEENELEEFSEKQSRITHGSPSAIHSAYLTALITKKLYTGELYCGGIFDFATDAANNPKVKDEGWSDIAMELEMVKSLPKEWASMHCDDIDPSGYIGYSGKGDTVLATAIAITDMFGEDDPVYALRRGMLTGGDSDSINALVGGFVGASHEDDIWGDMPLSLEPKYLEKMENIADFISQGYL